MEKELKEAVEDYKEKIHKRWLNARDSGLEAEHEQVAVHNLTISGVYNQVDLELTKILKDNEARLKGRGK